MLIDDNKIDIENYPQLPWSQTMVSQSLLSDWEFPSLLPLPPPPPHPKRMSASTESSRKDRTDFKKPVEKAFIIIPFVKMYCRKLTMLMKKTGHFCNPQDIIDFK
jgi:hypothetical protein